MDIAIIIAIIGAVASIFVAMLTHFLGRRKRADIQLVDVSVIGHPTRALFPILDFKMCNLGDGVAFLKRIQFEILEVEIDITPILEFYIEVDKSVSGKNQEEGDLIITIKNAGWGPARCIRLNNLVENKIRNSLRLLPSEYLWKGDIPSMGVAIIRFPKHIIQNGTNLEVVEPSGFVEYLDEKGTRYVEHVRYDPYPLEEYKLIMNSNGFRVEWHDFGAGIAPSRRYTIFLETSEQRYSKELDISHEIEPNKAERFQVIIASDKSATFKLHAKILYNAGDIIKSKPIEIKVYHPNQIWYYHYDELPSRQMESCNPTHFSRKKEILQEYDESPFVGLYDMSRYKARKIKGPPMLGPLHKLIAKMQSHPYYSLLRLILYRKI